MHRRAERARYLNARLAALALPHVDATSTLPGTLLPHGDRGPVCSFVRARMEHV